ncbi:MAG: MFS transporter, partial [Magnetospirillum sp.]|nr:MFS transporter [Magnetospirillum sp.]
GMIWRPIAGATRLTPPPLSRFALTLLVAESTAVQALLSLAMLALPAIAPKLTAELGLPSSLIGFQISIAYGGAMCTSLVAGSLVRRWGAVRTSQLALLASAVGCLGLTAGWVPLMAVASIGLGFGYGMINPAASHMLMKATSPANRNLVFSIKQSGVPAGGTLAGASLPPIALAFGWQWALVTVAMVAVGLALALQPSRAGWDSDRDPHSRLRGSPLSGLGLIWRSPRLRSLSVTGFAYAAVQLSLSTFAVTMLVSDLGWTLIQAGALLSALQIAGVAGRVAAGGLADRWFGGTVTLIWLGVLTGLVALLTGLMGPNWPTAAAFAVMVPFGAAALGWNGVYLAELAQAAEPTQIPRITGASLFFTYGGVLVGPSAFAALHGLTDSYTSTYALAALPAFAGAAILARSRS